MHTRPYKLVRLEINFEHPSQALTGKTSNSNFDVSSLQPPPPFYHLTNGRPLVKAAAPLSKTTTSDKGLHLHTAAPALASGGPIERINKSAASVRDRLPGTLLSLRGHGGAARPDR